jgi:hypothetical protein
MSGHAVMQRARLASRLVSSLEARGDVHSGVSSAACSYWEYGFALWDSQKEATTSQLTRPLGHG